MHPALALVQRVQIVLRTLELMHLEQTLRILHLHHKLLLTSLHAALHDLDVSRRLIHLYHIIVSIKVIVKGVTVTRNRS